jgi:predicted permease
MTLLRRIAMWARAILDRGGVESDLERERALHVELETAELIRRGLSPAEAARRAHVGFGGRDVMREAVRDERGTQWIDELRADLRYTLRCAHARPAFTAAVVLLIALGTGANSAIFSVVDRLVLRPLPYRDADRMVEMTATSGKGGFLITPSVALIEAWRTKSSLVESVEVSQDGSAIVGDTARLDAKRVNGSAVGPGMFAFVGMQPIRGRAILPADTLPGATPVVVIGYALWKRAFGGSDSIVGRTILLDGKPVSVIGVAPRGFGVPFSGNGELFSAMKAGSPYARDAIAKLKPGVTAQAAERELIQIKSTLASEKEAGNPRLLTRGDLNAGGTRRIVLLLFGAVALVLLIACANVANLLLARAWGRQREFALRAALGASRGRLLRQVFTESLSYAVLGGIGGLFVAMAFLKVVVAVQPKLSALANISTNVWIENRVLAWTIGISIATGLLFGMAPAFLSAGRGELLGASRTSTASSTARRFRSGLVITEVALSVVLLVGAGLLVRTMAALQSTDPGFEPKGIAAFALQLSPERFPDSTERRAVLASVLDAVKRRPGIERAIYAMTLPPDWVIATGGIELEGIPISPSDSLNLVSMNVVTPEYFRTVGIRLVRGRVFEADPRLTDRFGSNEVMINERLANRFWKDGNAIGARIKVARWDWATVVGIVRDVDIPGAKKVRRAQDTQIYFAMPAAMRYVSLIVRTPLPIMEVRTLVRDAVKSAGAGVRITSFTTADAEVAHSQAMLKFTVTLLGIFAALALVLAAVGLHAVIAYSVSQRTRELGIRMALGAESQAVARLVIGEGLGLGLAGTIAGCAAALAATRLLRAMLFGVQPHDPWTLGVVGAGLLLVSVAASAVPALRAMRINPVDMIRAE